MARTKEFDPEATLDSALECFKKCGYNGTSMSQLVEDMGIGRASLYATYGDKKDLFIAALRNYVDSTAEHITGCICGSSDPIAAIESMIREMASWAGCPDGRHGCFLVNTAAELGYSDEDIGREVQKGFGRIEEVYCRCLEKARKNGHLDSSKDPRALSRFLIATMQGLRVTGKSGADQSTLDDIAEVALSCLR